MALSQTQRGSLERLLSNETDCSYRRRVFTVFDYLAIEDTDRVLDCGCGRGYYLNFTRALSTQCELTGLEVDGELLDEARRKLGGKGIRFVQGDTTALPFEDASFDKIILSEVLEHVEDEAAALRELHRVLKPHGVIAVTVPNANFPLMWDPINKVLGAFGRPIRQGILAGIWANHVRLYTEEQLVLAVERAGFAVREQARLTYFSFPFEHNIVYGIGKELLLSGRLSPWLSDAADRFGYEKNTGSPYNPINAMRSVFMAIDRLNDELPRPPASVNIALKIHKRGTA
jgi:SAM-dependent methyltransferase